MKRIEVLSPVGSQEALKAAVLSGADAVYLGGSRFSARAYANNFDETTLLEAVFYAHSHDVKVYYALNTLIKASEMALAIEDVMMAYNAGVDAIILQDLGLIGIIAKQLPDFEIHGSTQMTVHNSYGSQLLADLGVRRVVLGRELSIEEIRSIKQQTQIELEIFVHGALCYAYSGQCLMSSLIGGRSGNRGRCAQTCRLGYQVQTKDGISDTAFVLSPKDINSLEHLNALMEIGVDSLKIEGRMKGEAYVAQVTRLYREGIKGIKASDEDLTALSQLFNRGGFTDGYLNPSDDKKMITMDRPNHQGVLVGEVIRYTKKKGMYLVRWFEAIHKGDTLRIDDENDKSFIINAGYATGNAEVFIKGKPIKGKTKIYRVVDMQLSKQIMDQLVDQKPTASGHLIAKLGKPLELRLTYKNTDISMKGESVEAAVKQPISKEWLQEQIQKTGNEWLDIHPMDVDMDDQIFVSTKAIKSLRRDAMSLLSQHIANPYKRDAMALPSIKLAQKHATVQNQDQKQSLTVLLRNRQQFETIIRYNVQHIYVDMLYVSQKDCQWILKQARGDVKLYLRLPTVIRQKDEAFIGAYLKETDDCDGYVVGSLDSFGYVKDAKKPLIADQGLWCLNNEAISMIKSFGISRYTISPELNYAELAALNVQDAIMSIYGYQGVMYSAQCPYKETNACDHKPGFYELIDRKENHLKVFKQCGLCINQIFNAHPLYLLDEVSGLKRIGVEHFRIDLLDEDSKTIERLMDGYHQSRPATESGLEVYTKGHFNKGVQ